MEAEVSTEMVLKLIGQVEKVEREDVDEEEEQIEGDDPAVGKEVGGRLTADREVTVAGGAEGEQITGTDTDKIGKVHGKSGGGWNFENKTKINPFDRQNERGTEMSQGQGAGTTMKRGNSYWSGRDSDWGIGPGRCYAESRRG